ncbi:MAG: hypothetical protein ACXADF_12440 [Candidatus Thorarchaeota archaeon]
MESAIMCFYANAFVRGKKEDSIVIPVGPPDLIASLDGTIQRNFSNRFQNEVGVFLSLHDGHCLCQFDNWGSLFRYLDEVRIVNEVDVVSAVLFWSDKEYDSTAVIVVDLGLEDVTERPTEGVVMNMQISVPRRLQRSIGTDVGILMKSGKTIRGILESYDEEGGFGVVKPRKGSDPIYFNENEIKSVSLPEV